MKLYFADNEEETEGFATSFFFDEVMTKKISWHG